MQPILQNYRNFLFVSFLFLGLNLAAQETRQDSIAKVEALKENAIATIKSQNFDKAVISLTEANKLATLLQDPLLKSQVLVELSRLRYYLRNYTKAEVDITNALATLEQLDDKVALGKAYTLAGLITTRLQKFKKSEEYLKKADAIFIQLNDEENRANVILALGILELKKKNYQVAINYFDATLPVFSEQNLPYQEAFVLLNKAEAAINLDPEGNRNPITTAKLAMTQAEKIIDSINFLSLNTEKLKTKAKIAAKENDAVLADTYYTAYIISKDSLDQVYIAAISKGVDQLSGIGNLQKKNAELQSDIDKKNKSINFTKMTTGLSIALIVILSLLTLSLYKNNNLRAKANNLLQDKNEELLLAKEKAEKATLAKAQFLSTITHELRTPLYAVTGLTHLLLEENPKEHQKDHLNSLKFSGEYLLSLINNILDLNKLEANKVEVEKTNFNLKKRINDVLVALKKSADDRTTKLHLEFDETIPKKLIGDPLKLSQVLINLIGNSVKFTQNGDVTIRVKRMNQHEHKAALLFEIEDNGVGISKKKQKSIFETFSQASLQINRKFGGTGLGLSIVKNLLELLDSKIHLESQLGKGSKFSFTINFGIAEEYGVDQAPKEIAYVVDYGYLENKKVLVVEDNKINQMITKKILEKNKLTCMVADNGMDAVTLVKENNFDIVLMDIHMPGISGIEATQKIREFNKELPIIALTAVTIDENLDEFYRAGFNEIIPKPFKTEEFFEKIHRTITNRQVTVG